MSANWGTGGLGLGKIEEVREKCREKREEKSREKREEKSREKGEEREKCRDLLQRSR